MYKTFTSFVENNQSIDENFIMDYINSELNNRNLEKYNNLISSKSTKFSIDKIKNITTKKKKNALGYANVQADIVGMEIIGSRNRKTARLDSDLDIVVELKGDNLREDDLFNLLNDNDEPLEINGIKVDINPIIVEKSGTLKEFMKRSNEYDKEHTI